MSHARDKGDDNQDQVLLDALSRRFREPLTGYFMRRVASAEDAEELTQEVFMRLVRREELSKVDNVDGFVFATASNLLKDHYRHRARHGGGKTASIEHLPHLKSSDPNPGQVVEDRDQIGVLMRAIEDLPPKCRAVFTLFRFEDVPQTEIARRMGITVSMVEKHIAAALITLKKKLKEVSDEPPSSPPGRKGSSHD